MALYEYVTKEQLAGFDKYKVMNIDRYTFASSLPLKVYFWSVANCPTLDTVFPEHSWSVWSYAAIMRRVCQFPSKNKSVVLRPPNWSYYSRQYYSFMAKYWINFMCLIATLIFERYCNCFRHLCYICKCVAGSHFVYQSPFTLHSAFVLIS